MYNKLQFLTLLLLDGFLAGLKFVQMQKNQAFHAGIKCTSFKATYGCNPDIKLEANVVPKHLEPLLHVASLTAIKFT